DRGLLTTFVDPKGGEHGFSYDALGFVETASDPSGYRERFERAPSFEGLTVTASSPEGRATAYTLSTRPGGVQERTLLLPDQSQRSVLDDLVFRAATAADGTETSTFFLPDMAFGAQSPVPAET